MGQSFPPRLLRPTRYLPTVPRSGNTTDDAWLRMSNAIIKGQEPLCYTVNYAGSLSLNEPIPTSPCTGTVAVTTGLTTIVGTGTAFLSEIRLGQRTFVVDAGGNQSALLEVEAVVSDTEFRCAEAPLFSTAGLTLQRLPVIFTIDDIRVTQIRGNTIRLNKGSLLTIGDGEVRFDGQSLSAAVTASREPSLALYDPATNTYSQFDLGMDTPVAPTLAAVGGGTKGMQGGNYSVVITPERIETLGYNNPSPRADVTIVTNDAIDITFPAMDTANGQNAWGVWVTTYTESLGTDLNYLNGPWFRLGQYTGNSAGFTETIEWLDAEVERNTLVAFNNDPPPQAEFVSIINNGPIWVSCDGAFPDAAITSPGPWVFPVKPDNVEAAPAELAFSTSPSEIILGVVAATGRLFLPTLNHLQVAIGTPSQTVPVVIQPFWKAGFKHENQLVFVDDQLFGFPTDGPSKSSANVTLGAEEVSPQSFVADVQSVIDDWVRGHVFVGHDPFNDAVCFFHSANDLNDDGFWTTRILMFGLRQNAWIGDVLLSAADQDMIVSGVTTVGSRLAFLAGGRQADNSTEINTYEFDKVAGETVEWAAAGAFSDNGSEMRSHTVKRVRITYRGQSTTMGAFGFQPTEAINEALLFSGNAASLTGAITVPAASDVTLSQQVQINCPNLNVSTLQVEGSYAGSGDLDRIDETLVEAAAIGVRR